MIILIIILVVSLMFSFPVPEYEDEILASMGEYTLEEYYTYGVFQDFTDYAKYTFENSDPESNEYLKQMTNEDIEKLNLYIDDFESWVSAYEGNTEDRELVDNYDFNREIISTNDYCYIYDHPDYPEFLYYNIYFYDTETEILYYFHNNN